ncbi:ABC-F family ATP-binding cassette domain-containing protein [Nakamurella leprariae]|uniref:ABC-F family ATP-binding cassette domain-containing protein n=1 Tax=Nakamurella leprariae TaxID=2803911 RepID=A0A939BZX7_9ACTN|nr:ABC-F family ATP-binding cassette domain-containing protein [Nakamurella leprariae]MBM9468640.1 ABC-F family ATP-binding cassette domain-containing protein [Nakamurella leprariae]
MSAPRTAGRASLVNLESVSVRHGVRQVLDQVSLGVQQGDRIGVLGLNGSGKSTLLQVLTGALEPDSGRVSLQRSTRIATVAQQATHDPTATVRQVVLQPFGAAEHVWASDSSIRAVLTGLGLTDLGLDSPVASLSGGEQRRVALAAALVTDADLVVLDEPTNHLDVEAVAWLAAHLQDRSGASVVVTHDRWFLDATAATTWEVVDGSVHIREGGYSDWVFARAERQRLEQAAEERRRNLARKELAWLRRGPPARTSKPRYRIEAAEALIADVPPARDTVALHQFARRRLGKDVLELKGITATVPGRAHDPGSPERVLLDGVDWIVGPGDRIGLVGVNGAGKSTLLRIAIGTQPPASGVVKIGQTVRLGYLSQDVTELPTSGRLLEAVTEVAGSIELDGKQLSASSLAERFGFGPGQQWTPVADLSGGERRRLQLMRILMAEPNVLVLDEPTNDLDTDTLAALEDLLDGWPGTLLVVSHDRYLLERVTDDVYGLLGDGRITHLIGGVPEYLTRRARAIEQGTASVGVTPPAAAVEQVTAVDAGQLRSWRKDLQRLERQQESLRRKQSQLHEKMAQVGSDFAAAATLDRELAEVSTALDEAELEWLEVAERIEEAG